MQLPGIVLVGADRPDLVKRAADVLARGFMEEPWFITWLSALDALGACDERKLEILRATFEGEFAVHAPLRAVYATEDFAGVAGGYLASEFGDNDHEKLEAEGSAKALAGLLTPEEQALLDEQSERMAGISNFSWAAEAAQADFAAGRTATPDHIYFYAWSVDANARGTGAFRRLVQPFFDYADEHGLNCYLDCFSDKLQSLYEHVGFELLRTYEDERFNVYERCMVRRPR